MTHRYTKNTRLQSSNKDLPPTPGLEKVKTDGRIGSTSGTPKGGLDVNTNSKAQSHSGGLGAVAAKHMGPSHEGGAAWSPRVERARRKAKPNPKPYANPVNSVRGSLRSVKPD